MQIRTATEADIPEMVILLRQLCDIETDFSFHADNIAEGLKRIIAQQPQTTALVAHSEDEGVIGMGTMQEIISTQEGGPIGVVEDVVVDLRTRQRGVGRAIVLELEKRAREAGYRRVQLLADRKNIAGIHFYAKMDWKMTEFVGLRKYV